MNIKRIIGLILFLSTIILAGCSNVTNDNDTIKHKSEVKQTIKSSEDKLLEYTEEGMNILKANYPTFEKMDLALKNIGNSVSNLTLNNTDGEPFKFNKLNGKKVILSVNKTDCSFCKKTSMLIDKVIKDTDIIYIPLFIKSTNDEINDYYENLNLNKPNTILVDENLSFIKEASIKNVPTLFFIDENNRISLIKEFDYDKITLTDDLKLAFESPKIYKMKVN
ncbi:thioredoxin fold domain-containing protein [Clostridioides difficile]|uniref:TlpA family protein disulfide reductase n=1 Tax=Clostridioides difficile TaxID=1496 RepID=UPI00202F8F6F|nr:thioredoxin fold domain-containing protein [Clostridioides difficile]MCM0739844.1 thioredoxin fold domain-containing protein [Clostridioides difficile]HBF2930765.1 thioredoxin fold domain-containing protein [Clostridioides difficile]HBF2935750.1 thioredoxin fold domain-containing protein [Clostridioides difficile]HBZ0282945.1 thioredoxin fold domain-containing protein [Clostridioides difficile]